MSAPLKPAGRRVAVVTGANKGIGLEIARGLLRELSDTTDVVLTARDVQRGEAAAQELRAAAGDAGERLVFRQLDLCDSASVDAFREWLGGAYDGLDCLVNNAGFAFKSAATEPFAQQAEETCAVNFVGTLRVCQALLPMLRPHARVVNVSSVAGASTILSPALRARVLAPELGVDELRCFVDEFIAAARAGSDELARQGWPATAYGVSKVAVSALTRIHARDFGGGRGGAGAGGVLINAMCPGWCKTDMAGHDRPPRTAAQGADTAVYLATLPIGALDNGKFFSDRHERKW